MSMSDNPLGIPPGMNYIAIIRPFLNTVIIGQTFLLLQAILVCALFYYSTPYSRRRLIFILNIVALAMAFTSCVIGYVVSFHMLLSPQHIWPGQGQLLISATLLGALQEMLVDTILLVRLILIYPLSRVGLARFVLITSLPIILKVARLVNIIIFTVRLTFLANGPNAFEVILGSAWLQGPYLKFEWTAQMIDNGYVTIAFLWSIRAFSSASTASDSYVSRVSFHQTSFAQRVRILFHLALSNYVIPTILSIIQLAALFRYGARNAAFLANLTYVTSNISVIGVVFATVWAGKWQRQEANASPDNFPVEHEQGRGGLEEWRVRSNEPGIDTIILQSHHEGADQTRSGASDKDVKY